MNNIFIVPIEPIDQRYTKQWYENIPISLEKRSNHLNKQYNIVTIDGDNISQKTTSGAFLDFASTNLYKAEQVKKISSLFTEGKVQAGDKFLVTDAWNFVITAIKYMSDLLHIPVEIHGIWHAGAYDPSDILGMKMSKEWPKHQEMSWFYCCDYSYFATQFHRNLFLNNLDIPAEYYSRTVISGQPHELLTKKIENYNDLIKSPYSLTVMWPHRLSPDKQPEIARDLCEDFNILITQELNLNKTDYYSALGKANIIFSCALHENLGISVMEGTMAGAIPVVPDRCSYSEMYMYEFKYPSHWTESYESFIKYKKSLIQFINERIEDRSNFLNSLKCQQQILKNRYLNANVMYDNILR